VGAGQVDKMTLGNFTKSIEEKTKGSWDHTKYFHSSSVRGSCLSSSERREQFQCQLLVY